MKEIVMKKKLIRPTVLILLTVILASGAIACSSTATTTTATTPVTTTTTTATTLPTATTTTTTSPVTTTITTTEALDEAAVRAFADEATRITMEGLSEGDLAKYTSHANAVFKAALDEATLQASAIAITSQLGTFESAEYLSWEMQEGYIIVHYRARYTDGTVGVRMVFDEDHLVTGQWFE